MSEPTLPGTVLRLARIYGPGDRQHRIFSYLKRMDDRRPAILLNEAVLQWRLSRAYAENTAWAIALAATNDNAVGRIYNIAEEECPTEGEWIRRIGNAVGWRGETVPVPGELLPVPYNTNQHAIADSSRIRQELGYSDIIAEDEAIKRTISWERANPPDEIDPSELDYASEDAILRQMAE